MILLSTDSVGGGAKALLPSLAMVDDLRLRWIMAKHDGCRCSRLCTNAHTYRPEAGVPCSASHDNLEKYEIGVRPRSRPLP